MVRRRSGPHGSGPHQRGAAGRNGRPGLRRTPHPVHRGERGHSRRYGRTAVGRADHRSHTRISGLRHDLRRILGTCAHHLAQRRRLRLVEAHGRTTLHGRMVVRREPARRIGRDDAVRARINMHDDRQRHTGRERSPIPSGIARTHQYAGRHGEHRPAVFPADRQRHHARSGAHRHGDGDPRPVGGQRADGRLLPDHPDPWTDQVDASRGEYVGDGVPRTFNGEPFEPLSGYPTPGAAPAPADPAAPDFLSTPSDFTTGNAR